MNYFAFTGFNSQDEHAQPEEGRPEGLGCQCGGQIQRPSKGAEEYIVHRTQQLVVAPFEVLRMETHTAAYNLGE